MQAFTGCTALKIIKIPKVKNNPWEPFGDLFTGCTAITEIHVDDIETFKKIYNSIASTEKEITVYYKEYVSSTLKERKDIRKGK